MSVVESTTEIPEHARLPDGRSTWRRQVATSWQRSYRRRIFVADLLASAVVAVLAFYVRFGNAEHFSLGYLAVTVIFPFLWVILLVLLRAYEPRFLFVGTEEFRKVVVAGGVLMIAIALVSYAGKIEIARGWVLLSILPVTFATLVMRYVLRKHLHSRRAANGDYMHRVVVVGYERATANLVRTLHLNPYHGLLVVGSCLPPGKLATSTGMIEDCAIPVLGGFDDVASAVAQADADFVVVLACPELDGPAMRRMTWELERSATELLVAPVLLEVAGPRVTVRPFADLPLMHVEHTELTHWRRALKTTFDRVGAAFGLLLVAPLMLAIAAIVKLSDPGPVFFRQVRIGYGGKAFEMLKFRTMRVGAEGELDQLLASNDGAGAMFKMREDPRVTKAGKFLRRYSLDELPQLVNVLRGQMSLVGPRPPLPREVEQYEWDVHRRFAVLPGITGLWQVSGRSDLEWDEAVRLDIRYVERWSLLLDVMIIIRTAKAVLRKSGAY